MEQREQFIQAMAAANQPEEAFSSICQIAKSEVGHLVFTVLRFDWEAGLARRIWSNAEVAYPVGGTKVLLPMDKAKDSELIVINSKQGIEDAFDDHQLIASLGCESCLCIPIIVGGKRLGFLNLMHTAGHFTPERVRLAKSLAIPGAVCFLIHGI